MSILGLGNLLAPEGQTCGLVLHDEDLDGFRVGRLTRWSSSGEMAIPVLVRLLEEVVDRYGDGPLNPRATVERRELRKALIHLRRATL